MFQNDFEIQDAVTTFQWRHVEGRAQRTERNPTTIQEAHDLIARIQEYRSTIQDGKNLMPLQYHWTLEDRFEFVDAQIEKIEKWLNLSST